MDRYLSAKNSIQSYSKQPSNYFYQQRGSAIPSCGIFQMLTLIQTLGNSAIFYLIVLLVGY